MTQFLRVPFARHFSPAQTLLVRQGFEPSSANDKWRVVCRGDLLEFRRSLTDTLIFRLKIAENNGAIETLEAELNRNPEEYRGRDIADDLAMIDFLIAHLLLKQEAPLPERTQIEDLSTRVIAHWTTGALDDDDDKA